MNIFSERASSRFSYGDFVSQCQTSSKGTKEHLSLSKELNIPLIINDKYQESNKRKNIKLFKSTNFNDYTFSTISSKQSKNEVDILSKLMNWDQKQLNQQQFTFNQYFAQKSKIDEKKKQNLNGLDVIKTEHKKQFNLQQNSQQVPQPKFTNNDQFSIEIEAFKSKQIEAIDTQQVKKNQLALNQYIISIQRKNIILPKLQSIDKNEKNNILTSLNRERKMFSVLENLQIEELDNKDDSINKDSEQQQIFRKRKTYFKKSLLRKRIIVILAVIRISKKYISILKERASLTEKLDQQKRVFQKFLDQFRLKNLQVQQRDFVEGIFKKLNTIIQDSKYIEECQKIQKYQDLVQRDIKKQRFCQFFSLFLQSLEIATQQNVLPTFIVHQINLNFFKTKDTQTCLFVSNRTQYYSTHIQKISRNQELMIASEYLIFNLILPIFFEIFRDLQIKDLFHNNQTLSYLTALTQMVQMFFVEHFQNLQKIDKQNVKPIQRTLKLNMNEDTSVGKSEIIITSNINSDETIIVENDFNKNSILELQNSKPYWSEKMKSRFNNVMANIEKHIMIKIE